MVLIPSSCGWGLFQQGHALDGPADAVVEIDMAPCAD
jgi:hypothetical protein